MHQLFSNRLFFSFSFLTIFGLTNFLPNFKLPFFHTSPSPTPAPHATEMPQTDGDVLGNYRYKPSIHISGGKDSYSTGGLIALSSKEEPSVEISAYNTSGEVQIDVWEADEQAVLEYLTHDKDGKQTKRIESVDRFKFIGTSKADINGSYGRESKALLPLAETGIYFLKISKGDIAEQAFIIRSSFGAVVKEGDDELIFWSQDFDTKRSLQSGTVTTFNLLDNAVEVTSAGIDGQGVAKLPVSENNDIALVKNDGKLAVVPLNLRYLNYGYSYKEFQRKERQNKFFTFTDRPLYRPGDTIYFKSVVRDDDDARYTLPAGNVTVGLYSGWSEEDKISEKTLTFDEFGTVSGDFKLPETAKTGDYHVKINLTERIYSNSYFQVEHFRKPEYSIDVNIPKTTYISKDEMVFTISGSYFSGQPLANQAVKYRVFSGDYYQYEYYDETDAYFLNEDYRYGNWWGNSSEQSSMTVTLNHLGKADVTLKLDNNSNRNRVYSIEAEFDNGSGNPSFVRKNMLVYAGEYDLYRKDYHSYYGSLSQPLDLPLRLVSHVNQPVSNIDLHTNIEVTNWVEERVPEEKYPRYRKVVETVPSISSKTDNQGYATFSFQPTKTGSYTFHVIGTDKRGNTISKDFYAYVTDKNYPYFSSEQDTGLSLQLDKKEYNPTDTATLSIFSNIPNRDIFLTFERNRVNRYQVLSLEGTNGSVEVPLFDTDMPNIYPTLTSFSDDNIDRVSENLKVSTVSKQLQVRIQTDKPSYGPGEVVTARLETSDMAGNPQSADVALWAVDKALFELVSENPKKISETFWSERYANTSTAHSLEGITANVAEMGGCFTAGTQILLANGTSSPIESIKPGDVIKTRKSETNSALVKAKVSSVHIATVSGILKINNNLEVTPEHIVWLNGRWQEIGNAQIGDLLFDRQGKKVQIASIEWLSGKRTVYNLEIENRHTYFANSVWVHNQKGGGGRTVFKDTAYWNPSVRTDTSGRAVLRFKLPDNLTTWVLSAVGDTQATTVGQTRNEIVVSKDVIVRPFLPNIIREQDDLAILTLVQNFTDQDHSFDINLSFDSGDVRDATKSAVFIKSKESVEVTWQVKATKVNPDSKLRFSAIATDNSKLQDVITQQIPVHAYGYLETRGETGYGDASFKPVLAKDSSPEKSSVTLSLSPSLVGMLPTAMQYLVDYPYGCVEQTTSRLMPVLQAKQNPELFADVIKDKNLDEMVNKGLDRLRTLQYFDGGWNWWSYGESNPFITAYVVENLVLAKDLGFSVDSEMLQLAESFLSRIDKQITAEDMIPKKYGLALLKSETYKTSRSPVIENSPDLTALAVMTNYLNGVTDPSENGLQKLIAMGKAQGDGLYWEAGKKDRFASKDASTALALRAILLAGTDADREIAVKAARYLTKQHRSHYWSNTYSTVQVIRAITALANTDNEANPNYTYSVTLDNKIVKQGTINSINQKPVQIQVPIANLKPNGSVLSISKQGEGQIYSTLVTKEFHTDRTAKAIDHGMTITREYVNEKGEEYSLGLGDTAIVKLTIGGLGAGDYYGVIADELPAGLIPVVETLKNEQYRDTGSSSYDYYAGSKEYTQNGVIISLYQILPGTRTYEYKARVVSHGSFIVPPATTSLMYTPEIYGQSDAYTLTIDKESKIIPGKKIQKIIKDKSNLRLDEKAKLKLGIILLVAVILIISLLLLRPAIRNTFLYKQLTQKLRILRRKQNPETIHLEDDIQQNPPPQQQ